jgi:hypothetical protein
MDLMIRGVVVGALALAACSGDSSEDGSSGGTSGADDGESGATADATGADDAAESGGGDATGGFIGGCGSPGWTTIEMPWSQINAMTTSGGGFAVCVPEPWTVSSDASNVIELVRDTPPHRVQLGGVLDLDHDGAVARLGQSLTDCDAEIAIFEIDGWPAIQSTSTYDVAPCGECPDPTPAQAHGVYTFVAAAEFMASVRGDTAAPPDATIVAEMLAIGATVTPTGITPPIPAETLAELAQLQTARDASCPP